MRVFYGTARLASGLTIAFLLFEQYDVKLLTSENIFCPRKGDTVYSLKTSNGLAHTETSR